MEHWMAVKRIFRYIKGTLKRGLCYTTGDNFELHGYSDADWAGDLESRKSTSGYIFRLGNCTISWRSKKQPIVALSSTEAEYVALCSASQEAIWLRNLVKNIGFPCKGPTTIHEDNQGAIALSKNPKDHPRTKHIAVKYHFIREQLQNDTIDLKYCPTGEMLADIFTKGLPRITFEKFRNQMGISEINNLEHL